ncbi:amidinotransferase [Oceanospirillum sp. D5]|uniref:Amidinotransferase n=2 Tax=Oceanospirillum sediminis TaxID=2760088 RepID=A0A839IRK3_9GAMM|nr:amidinotransferase [Oceanospirillum sediminis]
MNNYRVQLSVQSPRAVIMIRPHNFYPNPDTAEDNAYQKQVPDEAMEVIAQRAYQEVTQAAETLRQHNIAVYLFDDEKGESPDSVFPNNWFSTHPGGHVALYPMYSNNRRRERRQDIIETLKQNFYVQDVTDYSGQELDGIFLEGTGAMVLDHIERVAYTAKSNRANEIALQRFSAHFNYEPAAFDTQDDQGQPVYHTNVMMSIGTHFAMVGTELITDPTRRQEIIQRLQATGREVIALSKDQIDQFAGNVLELASPEGHLLALSSTAFNALTDQQKETLERYVRFVVLDIPTIELAGGSVRCMLAGLHLTPRVRENSSKEQADC